MFALRDIVLRKTTEQNEQCDYGNMVWLRQSPDEVGAKVTVPVLLTSGSEDRVSPQCSTLTESLAQRAA